MSYSARLKDQERYGEPFQVLEIERDGVVIADHSDHGEPEDNSFCRDWSWVPNALEQAYAFGVEDAQRAACAAADGAKASPLASKGDP